MTAMAEAKLVMDGLKLALDGVKMLQAAKLSAEVKAQLGQVYSAMLNAQQHASFAYARETELAKRVSDLEADLRRLETWDAEKKRYQFERVAEGQFAYAVKESERGEEPPHYICPKCYERREKSVFQFTGKYEMGPLHKCPSCNLQLVLHYE